MYENKYKVKKDLIYSDETFEIVGIMYDVWNKLGFGHKEIFYQKAIAEVLKNKGKKFKEQLRCNVMFGEKELGVYIFDFLFNDKIIIEIKQGENFSQQDIKQIFAYLKATKLKLGLLIHFTRNGVKFKRIVNL